MLAYLLKKFPRTSETFVLNEILGQEALGQEVHVFSRRAPDDEPRHPELAQLAAEVETLPSRHRLDPWEALFSDAIALGDVLPRMEELVREPRLRERDRFSTLVGEALHLLRRTRELGVVHVHAHFATDSAVVAMLVDWLGGPGYSITAHAKDIYRSTVDPHLLDLLFARARFVVTVCDANVRHVRDLVGPEAGEKVRRLYNGIDLSAFASRGASRDPRHVLAIGRLVEKKGFDVLLRAAGILARENHPLRVTVVGDGDEREALEALARELGLVDRVRFLGARDQTVVRGLMDSAGLLCLPCRIGADGNRDALPTVLLEALASGLPVVSTPVTGIPEIVDEGRAGILVPEDDPEATAQAIRRLGEDAEERERLAAHGRERVELLFDRRKIARTLNGWFQEALQASERECELLA